MSDTYRLADYFARIEDPSHIRTLDDGCDGCQHSLVFCRMVAWCDDEDQPCCGSCSH